MTRAAWRAQEGVPEDMTFKLGLGERFQGQCVCIWGAAASTGNSLGPGPGSCKERAGLRSTEVLGDSGAVTERPGKEESEGP